MRLPQNIRSPRFLSLNVQIFQISIYWYSVQQDIYTIKIPICPTWMDLNNIQSDNIRFLTLDIRFLSLSILYRRIFTTLSSQSVQQGWICRNIPLVLIRSKYISDSATTTEYPISKISVPRCTDLPDLYLWVFCTEGYLQH